ncbi:MAG: hypothetical protein K2P81_13540 [Bacteriovoracaceae bacterium]|nr:hypothetical protein [Bacteriovoracaceae bacterium]
MSFVRLFQSLLVVFSLVSLVSCGSNGGVQIVKGLKVETTVVNNEVTLRVSSDIDFGNIMFPSLQIPVIRNNRQIGTVSMVPVLGSKTQFVIEVNASALADLNVGPVLLPNGTLAPLIGTNTAISVDLGSKAQLYVAAATNAYALGVAIPISGLDSIGQSLGGINFFPMFAIDKATGAAGIFASNQPGKSGFGFFVDITQYVQGLNWGAPAVAASSKAMKAQALLAVDAASSMREISLDYSEIRPSSSQERKLNSILYNMNRRKAQLAR